MVESPQYGISRLSFDSTVVFFLVLFLHLLVAFSPLFFCFVFPPLLFTNFSVFFVMEHTLFCMALVELLGVSWSMVCAACCHRHWCYYVYF